MIPVIGLLLGVAIAVVFHWWQRAEVRLRRAGARLATLERELAATRRIAAQMEQEQRFFQDFLRDLPQLAHALHGGARERDVPALLLTTAMRSLEAEQGVVLLRRKPSGTDPGRSRRLVVAAVAPEQSPLPPGLEVVIGEGPIGYVAECQRVMSRADFDAEPLSVRTMLRDDDLPGFRTELVAPMVVDEDTVGVIALSGPRRTMQDAKNALRLIAQSGAQALHNLAAFSRVKYTAELDPLTQAFNKVQITRKLTEAIQEADLRATPLSVFLLDIDNFKHYNDGHGHLEGDRLLQQFARLVQENIRKDDVLGRFGGEEFLLVLPGTTLPQALAVAYKIRALISSHGFRFAETQPLGCLSVSGGVAEYPADGEDSASLLRSADAALYEAKRQGRNRVLAAPRQYLGDGLGQVAESA